MKREKAIGIAFVAINLILVVVCIVLYSRRDKTEPKFLIQAVTIIYTPGANPLELMEGIEAYDNHDGDVTDRIVIEKIVEDKPNATATVYYAVSDKAGNVAKFSKLFPAEFPEKTDAMADGTDTVEAVETLAKNSGEKEVTEQAEQEAEGSPDDLDTEGENGNAGEAEPEETEDEADTQETEQPQEPAPAAAEQPSAAPANTGAPELVLKTSEATIQAGTNVPWTEIITTMRDDKDDYATLYYNLHVSQYNRNKPGSYPVTVYVEDSDGNTSRSIPFTIIVQ